MKKKSLISISGSFYSGSGALIDLLQEYEELSVISKPEFLIGDEGLFEIVGKLYKGENVDVTDLERARKKTATLGKYNPRFLFKLYYLLNYLRNKTIGTEIAFIDKFKKYVHKKKNFGEITSKYDENVNILFDRLKQYNQSSSIQLSEILEQFIARLFDDYRGSDEIPVVNQMVPAHFLYANPGKYIIPRLIKNTSFMLVLRDPRDQYVEINKYARGKLSKKGGIDWFINEYSNMYRMYEELKGIKPKNLIIVQFEDLIYRNDQTVAKIEDFLNLSNENRGKKVFFPKVSKENTMLFREYANRGEIDIIEDKMKRYLYGFPNDHVLT